MAVPGSLLEHRNRFAYQARQAHRRGDTITAVLLADFVAEMDEVMRGGMSASDMWKKIKGWAIELVGNDHKKLSRISGRVKHALLEMKRASL